MIESCFSAVVELSLKGAWVVLLVAAVRVVVGGRLSAPVRLALWALVAVRLMVPVLPQSPFSVQQSPQLLEQLAPLPAFDAVWSDAGRAMSHDAGPASGSEPWVSTWTSWRTISFLWLLGSGVLALRFLRSWGASRGMAGRSTVVADERLSRLYRQCRLSMGADASLRDEDLRLSSEVSGPMVVGFMRPVILLPVGLPPHLDDDALRAVLLHEIAHVSRRDPRRQLVACFILCVHWFNPLVWAAFFAFREDLESACDAAVLGRLGTADRRRYGHTLLNLGIRPGPLATAPFAVNSRRQLIRRLEMIARFKSQGRAAALASAALVLSLAALAWTDLPVDADEQRMKALSPQEIAAVFADKIGTPSDEDPGAVAAELKRLWEANRDRAPEIKIALQEASDRALAEGRAELAGSLAKMIVLLAEEDGLASPLEDRPDRVKATVQVLRQAGAVLWARFGEVPEGAKAGATHVDWSDCSPVSAYRLRNLAESQGWGPVPVYDGWGHELDYCVDSGLLAGGEAKGNYRFGVRSPGSDGETAGASYRIGAFDSGETSRDLVWIDGYFATWPGAPKS